MFTRTTRCLVFLVMVSLQAVAVAPVTWELTSQEDFHRQAEYKGVSISRRGTLRVSPQPKRIWQDDQVMYIWKLAAYDDARVYASTGSVGRILVIEEDEVKKSYDFPEPQVLSLAVGKRKEVYAGTGPEGRIYRLRPGGSVELFCELEASYVWDLCIDAGGNLLAATGDTGKLYRIDRKGHADVLFESTDPHVMCLEGDGHGNVYFGTQGDGLVYLLAKDGGIQALFDAPEPEIRDIIVTRQGDVYVGATTGLTQSQTFGMFPGMAGETGGAVILSGQGAASARDRAGGFRRRLQSGQPMDYFQALFGVDTARNVHPGRPQEAGVVPSNAVYHLDAQGRARRIFFDAQLQIFGLAENHQGTLLLGSGNPGRLVMVDEEDATILFKGDFAQVIDMLRLEDGKILVCTANPSGIFMLNAEGQDDGVYTSRTLDAQDVADWGKIRLDCESVDGISMETRTGNVKQPDHTWTDWRAADPAGRHAFQIASLRGRFLQFRMRFSTTATAEIYAVILSCLPRNHAPQVRDIQVPINAGRYSAGSMPQLLSRFGQQQALENALKTGLTVSWSATDQDHDPLTYTILVRAEGQKTWTLLAEHWDQQEFLWDTRSVPDGRYQFQIRASDERANLPGQGMQDTNVSDYFVIDNTPPRVQEWQATKRKKGGWKIRGVVTDQTSTVVQGAYSLNGEDWKTLFPRDKIFDSPEEAFEIHYDNPSEGEQTVTVQVMDNWGNRGSGRMIFRIPRR